MHTHIHIHVHIHTHIHIHVHMHTHIHIHVRIHTYTHTHIRTERPSIIIGSKGPSSTSSTTTPVAPSPQLSPSNPPSIPPPSPGLASSTNGRAYVLPRACLLLLGARLRVRMCVCVCVCVCVCECACVCVGLRVYVARPVRASTRVTLRYSGCRAHALGHTHDTARAQHALRAAARTCCSARCAKRARCRSIFPTRLGSRSSGCLQTTTARGIGWPPPPAASAPAVGRQRTCRSSCMSCLGPAMRGDAICERTHAPRDKIRAAARATRDRARTPGGELQSICSETALPAPSSAVFSRRAVTQVTAHVSRAKLRLLPLLGTNSQCQASRLAHGG
jgi:hypothetical protein